jgi:teichuronic acid biosynthesis glycosyltransferase TuaG
MTKLVSIIMPVFNAGQFIEQAVQSVLDQTYGNWELLIVNDGSTDDSLHVVQKFNDERIFIFHQANRGVSAARNAGLANMRGEFFCFLDADDILPPSVSIPKKVN